MPSKRITKKSKNEPNFTMFIMVSILTVFVAYLVAAGVAKGVAMFFRPYIAYINENREKNYGRIEYATDKTEYMLGESIKLTLINNLKESIYLAPCRYFKTFENKKLTINRGDNREIEWQPLSLVSDPECSNSMFDAEDESFNKIKKITDEYVSTKDLGIGIFRGVSTVYLRCTKPDANSCEGGVNVFSNEFKINGSSEKTKE